MRSMSFDFSRPPASSPSAWHAAWSSSRFRTSSTRRKSRERLRTMASMWASVDRRSATSSSKRAISSPRRSLESCARTTRRSLGERRVSGDIAARRIARNRPMAGASLRRRGGGAGWAFRRRRDELSRHEKMKRLAERMTPKASGTSFAGGDTLSPSVDQRKMAGVKTGMKRISLGRCTYRGSP